VSDASGVQPGTRGKRGIRELVRAGRAARDAASRGAAEAALTARLSGLVAERGARRVACYLPVGGEPDTRGFLAWARGAGVEAILPLSRDDGLLDWAVAGDGATAPGAFGIPEPIGDPLPPGALGGVDLALIPACAVDRSGVRLGWGRGYFDRALAALDRIPPVFAVVHDDEVFDALPREPHDVPVAGAVTPARVLLF
jgi:5-formyltetrahydrofolate cyclo-ligase